MNEALLFAPVLLLTVVALLFMRFFPLVVRYLSGDSPALIHLIAALTLASLALMAAARGANRGQWSWMDHRRSASRADSGAILRNVARGASSVLRRRVRIANGADSAVHLPPRSGDRIRRIRPDNRASARCR